MFTNRKKITIGSGIVLLLFGVMLGSLVNVQGPTVRDDRDFVNSNRNAPILMQVGSKGNGLLGYSNYDESRPNSHWIQSISYGVQSTPASREKTVGRPSFLEIAVVKISDAATPVFFNQIARGTVFSEVTIVSLTLVGATQVVDWKIDLLDVVFTSMAIVGVDNSKGQDGGGNQESITFNYQQITITHTVLSSEGDTTVSSCWNVVKNGDC